VKRTRKSPITGEKRGSEKVRPDLDNRSVGSIDEIGNAVERVFGKARSPRKFCPLGQEKSAALLLHYTVQMRASDCNSDVTNVNKTRENR
jgi:hypothetical protein